MSPLHGFTPISTLKALVTHRLIQHMWQSSCDPSMPGPWTLVWCQPLWQAAKQHTGVLRIIPVRSNSNNWELNILRCCMMKVEIIWQWPSIHIRWECEELYSWHRAVFCSFKPQPPGTQFTGNSPLCSGLHRSFMSPLFATSCCY